MFPYKKYATIAASVLAVIVILYFIAKIPIGQQASQHIEVHPIHKVVERDLCPEPNTLKLVNGIWEGPESWYSFGGYSFTKEVDRFDQAHWRGTTIGSIECSYDSINSTDFPVVLRNNWLVFEPSGDNWRKQPNGEYICQPSTHAVEDCLFAFKR